MQARKIRLRHGVLGFCVWVKLSESWRARRMKAFKYRSHKVLQVALNAWKNKLYPLGLRRQWGTGIRPYLSSSPEEAAKEQIELSNHQAKELAPGSREIRCLETTEAATADDWKSSAGCDSLVLLRLPMVGQRMRRVLYVWRKRVQKEKRVRYIREALPRKVSLVSTALSRIVENIKLYLD